MRIRYEFISDEEIFLPYSYNECIQALIYTYLFPDKRKFLHEEGFAYENRKFKLFTFSRILKKPKKIPEKKLFNFGKRISFILSSPLNWILEDTAENLIKTNTIRLFRNSVSLYSINVMPREDFLGTEKALFRTLSPVTVYSTFPDKERPFHYYSPYESEFFIQIINNIKKKFFIYYKKKYEGPIKLRLAKFDNKNGRQVVWFKKQPITAWNFVIEIEAEREVLYLAYYAGVGAKNSAGFGCIEEVKNVRGN